MKLNNDLIKKCIELNADLDMDGKIAVFSFNKIELENGSDTYNKFLVNVSYAFITAYSLFDKVVDIRYCSTQKIIGEQLVENLNNYLEKIRDKSGAWELDDETIIRKIGWILNNPNEYEENKC